jgi:hypothetical protein
MITTNAKDPLFHHHTQTTRANTGSSHPADSKPCDRVGAGVHDGNESLLWRMQIASGRDQLPCFLALYGVETQSHLGMTGMVSVHFCVDLTMGTIITIKSCVCGSENVQIHLSMSPTTWANQKQKSSKVENAQQ